MNSRNRALACALAIGVVTSVLAAESAFAVTLVRGPYLQLLSTNGVTVVWNTDVAAACSLAVRPLTGTGSVVSGPTSTVCAIRVANLAPGTQYAYTPRAGGAALTGESVFETDDPGRPFVFLVFGDSGGATAKQMAVRDRMLATPADFILHTGDMVYDDGAAADFDPKFFQPYRDLVRRLVIWPTLGNHDFRTADGGPWRAAFRTPANNPAGSENYYSFNRGNAHIVVLDSNSDLGPGSPQHDFLDADLAATTARWKFVAFHHPVYSSGVHGSALGIRADVVPLFDEYGVDVVFAGHDHNFERTLPLLGDRVVQPGAGTVYITTGGGGQTIRAVGRSNFTDYSESSYHFTRVAVNGDNLLVQMIREDGAVRDATTLTKGSAPPPARCGDGIVNQGSEQCDGADRPACVGACTPDCTCAPLCGDGLRNQANEACDGPDDAACPGRCLTTCACGAPTQFVTLAPEADTYIEAGTQASWDHGAADHLDVDLAPFGIAYLRFDLRGVTAPVNRATLTLHCINPSPDAGTVYPVADSSWIEGTATGADAASATGPGLKWNDVDTNRDGKVDARDSSPYLPDFARGTGGFACVDGEPVDVDVTPLFGAGPRIYSVAVKNGNTDGSSFSSGEDTDATQRPRLRLELGGVGSSTTTTTVSRPTTTSTTTTTTSTTTQPSAPRGQVVADVVVKFTEPTTNFGAVPLLEADTTPAEGTYFRVEVSGLGTRSPASARLRLQVADVYGAPSDSGGRLRAVPSCAWDEGTITWNTRPAVGTTVLATAGAVDVGDVVDLDVTSAINGDGTYCFALDTVSANGVIYVAREGTGMAPALTVSLTPISTTTTTTTLRTTTTVPLTTTTTPRITTTTRPTVTTTTIRRTTTTRPRGDDDHEREDD